jgi:transglutaminase-like putative cysteine protease
MARTPPFSFGDRGASEADTGSISNPGLPSAGTDGVVDFAPEGYPGFSSAMDLRARGRLSDEIAFRVRTDQPALWRGEVFDTFDGSVWTASNEREVTLPRSLEDDGFDVPVAELDSDLPPGFTRRVVQTFYLDSIQPNVLFTAGRADRVYFPAAGLQMDRFGAIRSPILLDEGLIYSVISQVPSIPFEVLRRLPTLDPDLRSLARYLQLPDGQPPRVADLARTIVAGSSSEADAVSAVEAWLATNTVYDLQVPREPEGVDAVDHFLFETRRGFCEHIASAMVVLLRSVGIPARIVVGFGPGERNLFTGYWEVRQSDAHAWVEVWYPEAGWLPYDPTFGVPAVERSFASRFPITEVVAAVGAFLRGSTPQPVKAAIGAVGSAATSGLRLVGRTWPAALLVLALVTLAVVLARRGRRRRRARVATDPVGRAFEDLLAALTASGHAHDPGETPREVLAAARATWPDERRDVAEVVVTTFERSRWAPPEDRPDAAEAGRAADVAAMLRRSSARP